MKSNLASTMAAVITFAGALVAGELPSFFQPPPAVLGNADIFGHVVASFRIGEFPAGAGMPALPLLAVFNTGENMRNDSCLGRHWWLPLVEACVYEMDEKSIRAQSPGGQTLDLVVLPDKPGHFLSKDHQWRGVSEGSSFSMKHKDGWALTYDHGRIKHIDFPGGNGLAIKRHQPGGFTLSWDKGGGEYKLLADKDGLLSKVEGPAIDLRCEFDRQVPILTSSFGRSVVSGLAPSLRRVTDQKLGLSLIDCETEYDDEKKVLTFKGRDLLPDGHGSHKQMFKWDGLSGMIIEDDLAFYHVGNVGNALQGLSYSLQRAVKDGATESIDYDATRGLLKYEDGKGHQTESLFIMTPGVTFGKLRKSTTLSDGRQISSLKFDYDSTGKCLRSTSTRDSETTEWKRDPEGVTIDTPLGKIRFSK